MKKENTMITDWLDQNSNPEIDRLMEVNFAYTEKIRLALERRSWNKGDLAKAMGKNNSEVSKWLNGMHNFTTKSLIKIEMALDIKLLYTEADKEYVFMKKYVPVAAEPQNTVYSETEQETNCYFQLVS